MSRVAASGCSMETGTSSTATRSTRRARTPTPTGRGLLQHAGHRPGDRQGGGGDAVGGLRLQRVEGCEAERGNELGRRGVRLDSAVDHVLPAPGVTVQTQTWVGSGVYNTLTEKTEDYSKWHLGKNGDFTTDAGVRTTSSLYELSGSLNTTNTKLTMLPRLVRCDRPHRHRISRSEMTGESLRQLDRSAITGKVTGTESVHAGALNIDYGTRLRRQPRAMRRSRVSKPKRGYDTWWTEDSAKVKTLTTTGETVDLGRPAWKDNRRS